MKQAAAATFDFIEPMKALPVTDLPVGDWIYELKFDGYRALAFKAGKGRGSCLGTERISTTIIRCSSMP